MFKRTEDHGITAWKLNIHLKKWKALEETEHYLPGTFGKTPKKHKNIEIVH